jgi:hypothetical protein
MKTAHNGHRIKRTLAGTLPSDCTALAALGLASGTAHAFNYPIGSCNGRACSYVWFPGMLLPSPSNGKPNWDMSACHHFMIGQISPNSPAWVTNGGNNRQVSPKVIEGDPVLAQGASANPHTRPGFAL